MDKYDDFFPNLSDGTVIKISDVTFTLAQEQIRVKSVPQIVAVSRRKK